MGIKSVIMIVGTNPDPSREKEFNDWYTNRHQPMIIQAEGMVRAHRYKLVDARTGDLPKYLAIYELEDEESIELSEASPARRASRQDRDEVWGVGGAGLGVSFRGYYKHISSCEK